MAAHARLARRAAAPEPSTSATRTTPSEPAVSGGALPEGVPAETPAVIPPEMCYLGWQESLVMLAALVEPEIPG